MSRGRGKKHDDDEPSSDPTEKPDTTVMVPVPRRPAGKGAPSKIDDMIIVEDPDTEAGVMRPLVDVLVEMIDYGVKPELAADAVGVDKRVYYLWTHNGRDAAAKLAEGYDLNERELRYLHFLHGVQHARGGMQRRLEARLAELIPNMETREVTDVLARLDKVKWAKASSMKLDVSGELNIVEQSGQAVTKLVRLIVEGLIEAGGSKAVQAKLRAAAPEIVQLALAAVVVDDRDPATLEAG